MKLPKLLAGPIVRRIEQKQAFIWIATSSPYEVEADLFVVKDSNGKASYEYHPFIVSTDANRVSLGESLHIYLIRIKPQQDSFPLEELIGYNLRFMNNTESWDLESLDLLSDKNPLAIVYRGLKYPTFFLSDLNEKLLFGSCRKLHGKGKDALASGDIKLNETYFDLKERPGALFLVGDQIYADDVGDPIFPFLFRLGKLLIGKEEYLEEIDERLKAADLQKALRQVRGRKTIMEKLCKFTSSKSHNHLISFGEYSAMYLLSLSPEIWGPENEDFQTMEELISKGVYHFIFPEKPGYEDEFATELIENQKRYEEQLEAIQSFRQTLPQVRRLLANIPTYMMFDDHDITDDFNISFEWKKDVEERPLGRHVIANGLAVYWAFQGWGNAPDQYNHAFLEKMKSYFRFFDVQSIQYDEWQNTLLQFEQWSFVSPTKPKALFLDTRTKRAYPQQQIGKSIKELHAAPQLIDQDGWKTLSDQLVKSGWKSGSPLILVSPAPFYGIRLIEAFLYQYVLPLKILRLPVQTRFDLEAWHFNGKGYHEFHEQISKWNPSSCIILSGDAHMASSVETIIAFPNEEQRKLQQFTSSPMKNDSFSILTAMILKGILRLHSLIYDHNHLHRSCNDSYHLMYGKNPDKEESCLWKESIHYLSLPSGSIIETDNNLGMLRIVNDEAKVNLLQWRNSKLDEKSFKR